MGLLLLLPGGPGSTVSTVTYQFQQADNYAFNVNVANISGATSVGYTPVDSGLIGKYIARLDTVTDDGGSVTQLTNVLGPLRPVTPFIPQILVYG
jgi:hypothetical protein